MMSLRLRRLGKKGLRTMLRDKLLMQLAELAGEELAEADKIYKQFSSPHEGWAVIKEEVDEADESFDDLEASMDILWCGIRHDMDREEQDAESVFHSALLVAAECVQVMAMCTKMKKGKERRWNG